MPRKARLDIPGLLQHIMARGIESRNIFLIDRDRDDFVERLAIVMEETKTKCYAWAMLPNHFHLLLRPGPTPLSKVMRRFMTGYAVSFNLRHHRKGHLFQNRYKSVICEQDPYFLELLRYIHLNPLRIGIVKDVKELARYPWAGHSVLAGNRINPLVPDSHKKKINKEDKTLAEKTVEEILGIFSEDLKEAREKYCNFIEKGVKIGVRPELRMGEQKQNPNDIAENIWEKGDTQLSDPRILGNGSFVEMVLRKAKEINDENKPETTFSMNKLITKIISYYDIDMDDLLGGSQKQAVSKARCVICYIAVKKMRWQGTVVAKVMRIRSFSALRCAERGKKIFREDPELCRILGTMIQNSPGLGRLG
ncbi:transposase [Candidatus Magnetomoraceae bacterium gMMP-15]